ncbi:MAG TPA: inositol monophosphatase family protein [Candidatus Methylomirabilis sp.]|nr:inositol monophosphatase family protein [Candidatus Methylomirabilis sp.]
MTAERFRISQLPRTLQPLVAEAISSAQDAGRILKRRFRGAMQVWMKGQADVVTATDLECQTLIVGRLRRRFPAHGVLAEEGLNLSPGAEWRWILDPLDGTKNFARGVPSFCVSIAAEREGRVELGVVHDPIHGETFVGVHKHGVWCNERPIRVSDVATLGAAFLATGLPHRVRRFVGSVSRTFGRFSARTLGVRDRGAGALDLCYVACGRFDGYWEIDQSPWDIAAGGLIVTEAGGRMSDFRGGGFDIYAGETVASNGKIHDQILAVLALPGGIPGRHHPPVHRSTAQSQRHQGTKIFPGHS